MTTTDLVVLGKLSPRALAAGALGFNLYFPLLLFGVGVLSAISPIIARLVGANADDLEGPRRAAHQSIICAGVLTLTMWIVLWNAQSILIVIGEPRDLSREAVIYLHGLQWAMLPNLLFFAMRSVFAALNRTGPTLITGLAAVGVNAVVNWVLVFGHLGFPAWGLFGSGIATFISQVFMFLALAAYAFVDPQLVRYRLFGGPWQINWESLKDLCRLGVPTGATIAFEVSIFSMSVLMMGFLGGISLEAHAIALQISSLAFMVPLGLSQAATVRIGYAFGRRDRHGISDAGSAAFLITMACAAIAASAMVFFPRLLISGFLDVQVPDNAEIVARAETFLRVAAVLQLFNAAQAVGAGMLRGLHDAHAPMLAALIGYWGIALPLGALLAFLTPLGGTGLWLGLTCGLAAVSIVLLIRWRMMERGGFS